MAELTLAAARCDRCELELAPGSLDCAGCGRLVYAAQLQHIAGEAERAEGAGDRAAALRLWEQGIALLPAYTKQHEAVSARIAGLRSAAPERGGRTSSLGLKAGAGAAILFVLTKGKLLLLGFTKLGTVSSMLVSFGAYWGIYGWPFAAGMVLSIYVHEIGHVAALRGYGIQPSAPMFIPGFGAMVRWKRVPTTPAQEARIGLAGPLWGLGAAAACYAGFLATGVPLLAALAGWGAFLNLMNLTPVGPLDGARAFDALTRNHRAYAAAAVLAAWILTREGLLFLPLAGAAWQLFRPAPREEDAGALGLYVLLIAALAGVFYLAPGLPG